jgi:hypothetical protein
VVAAFASSSFFCWFLASFNLVGIVSIFFEFEVREHGYQPLVCGFESILVGQIYSGVNEDIGRG